MYFVVIGKDGPDPGVRRKQRPAHLEYVAARQQFIVYAGPLIVAGAMVGSLFVFDVPDRAALDAYMAGDPYFSPGIFASVEIFESRRMVPEGEAGDLLAEAERARNG